MENKHNFDDLSNQLVDKVSAGQDVSPIRAEINSMSSSERLQFVQVLNKAVSDDTLERVLNGTFSDRLLLDVRLANNGTVADIDLLRRAKSSEPDKHLTRIDLFDSANEAGREADEKQRLDAITNPYEEYFFLCMEQYGLDGDRKHSERARDAAIPVIVSRMTRDVVDPAEAKRIESNFLSNLDNAWERGVSPHSGKHSRSMFEEGSHEGGREKVVPVDLQRDLDKLYRSNSLRSGIIGSGRLAKW